MAAILWHQRAAGDCFTVMSLAVLEAWLANIRSELIAKTYRPAPVRRVLLSITRAGPAPGRNMLILVVLAEDGLEPNQSADNLQPPASHGRIFSDG